MQFDVSERARLYQDKLLAFMDHQCTLRLADGPDEVHKRTMAQVELRRIAPEWNKNQ